MRRVFHNPSHLILKRPIILVRFKVAGDFCDFPDDEEQLSARKAEIRATTNMTELDQALGVDAFYE